MIFPAVLAAAVAGQPSPFQLQVFLVCGLGLAFASLRALPRLGPAATALCAYLCISAFARATVLESPDVVALLTLRHTALLVLCTLLAVIAREAAPTTGERGVAVCLGVAGAATLVRFPPIYNTSINAALLSCLVPFTGRYFSPALLTTAAVVISAHTATGLAALLTVALSHWRLRATLPIGIAFAAAAFFGRPTMQQPERLEMWRLSIESLWTRGAWVFGTGYGTFHHYGPELRRAAGLPTVWYTMHSDVLQVIFETGVVGAVLFTWVVASAFRRQTPEGRASLAALLVTCLWNFPLEIPAVLFFAVWLCLPPRSR
jgi:hypothetical protein